MCKRRGFVYPGSDIYGGLANTWDWGPLGVELKNNLKKLWWQTFVQKRSDIYGLDGGILLNPKIWQASGHTERFVDPLIECRECQCRFRSDLEENKDLKKCPECGGTLGEARLFNPMFKTFVGPVEEEASVAYLRPETAQAIFVNFKNILDSFHPEVPFGIAQIGKAFRNEITAGNFIFRSLEFEQMEIEYFIQEKDWEKSFVGWKKQTEEWLLGLGVSKKKVSWRAHSKEELSHYSKRTEDMEYDFPFGTKELFGLAYRTDFDLQTHGKSSGRDLKHKDQQTNKEYYPHVIEPSMGVERLVLAILLDAYKEDGARVFLKLDPRLAPVKVAVFPLSSNKPELVKKAKEIYTLLGESLVVDWDDRGNVGKRYYAQDEVGTPWCVTVDFETLEDGAVTVRDRDTTKQTRVKIDKLPDWFQNRLK